MRLWRWSLLQALVLIIGIVLPILLFKIWDPEVAGFVAGIWFIAVPVLNLWLEARIRPRTKIYLWAQLQFLFIFAIPIWLTRVTNWGVPSSDLSVLGIPFEYMHKASVWSYTAMIVMYVYNEVCGFIRKIRAS